VSDGPLDLLAFVPARCPEGHYLRDHDGIIGGSVTAGFDTSCQCPAAMAKAGAKGHQYAICRACEQEGSPTTFCDPPCTAGG
jgi:hypothetical protein